MRDWRERQERREWRRYSRHHYRGPGSAWGGIVLLSLGVLLLLDRMGILYFRDVFRYWPMVFVAAGLAHLSHTEGITGRLFSGLLIAAGIVLTANNLGYLGLRGDLFWPFVLIGVGVLMLGRALEDRTAPPGPTPPDQVEGQDPTLPAGSPGSGSPRVHASVVFSSAERTVTAQNFETGKLEAVFGAVELDLRQAGIASGQAVVKADAVFGGIDILVPETWDVDVRGEGVFGAVNDETRHPDPSSGTPPPRLVVKGAAVFGAVTVGNRPHR